MTEYIKRNYLRKMAMFETAYTMETETDAAIVLRMIDDAPTADVAPVVHGQWILEREPNGKPYCFHCSVCDSDYHCIGIVVASDYCPNCGARMNGGKNDAPN